MRLALVLLLALVLASCDEAPEDGDMHQEFDRLALHDCQGTIPLEDLPIERELLSADRLIISREGERVTLRTENGDFVIAGADAGRGIEFIEIEFEEHGYEIAIDANLPARYAEIDFSRVAYFDGDVLTIEDEFFSYGDRLTCQHEFDMSAIHWDRLSVSGSIDTRFDFGEGAECLLIYPTPASCSEEGL